MPVEVDVLSRPESVTLLRDRVPGLAEADADGLAAALGDLPLAVAQADTGGPAARSGHARVVPAVAGRGHRADGRPARRR